MRVGVNPEKYKELKNKQYSHRIVMPVFIPNTEEVYYSNSLQVFKMALKSIIDTIDNERTAITIINNNSCHGVIDVLGEFSQSIDKLVAYNENKGKVYAVLNEVRGIFEEYVTICDADVLFLKGWEAEVFKVFNNFKKAGVVAPLPCQGLAFNNNSAVFCDSFFSSSLKYGQIVDERDNRLYLEGLGNKALLNRNNRDFHWYEKQYYLKKNNVTAVIGAGHFVATYKSEMFKNENSFPKIKFLNGYEDKFIDILADKNNLYRLSTVKAYAYHIGNNLDSNVNELINDGVNCKIEDSIKFSYNSKKTIIFKTPYSFRKLFFRVLKKVKKL